MSKHSLAKQINAKQIKALQAAGVLRLAIKIGRAHV